MKSSDFIKVVRHIKATCRTEEGKKRVLSNPKEVFKESGISVPKDVQIKFVENNKQLLNLVVPKEKLPKSVCVKKLPRNPSYSEIGRWLMTEIQSNSRLKERILKEPIKVLQEHNIPIGNHMKVKIYQNTEKMMYFVIPRIVHEGEELSDVDLQSITGGAGKNSQYIGGDTITSTATASPTTNPTLSSGGGGSSPGGEAGGGEEGGDAGEGSGLGEFGELGGLLGLM